MYSHYLPSEHDRLYSARIHNTHATSNFNNSRHSKQTSPLKTYSTSLYNDLDNDNDVDYYIERINKNYQEITSSTHSTTRPHSNYQYTDRYRSVPGLNDSSNLLVRKSGDFYMTNSRSFATHDKDDDKVVLFFLYYS